MIDVELILIAYAVGIRLISYAWLVMACGLAMDYCVHIGHARSNTASLYTLTLRLHIELLEKLHLAHCPRARCV